MTNDITAAASRVGRPASFVCVNLQNFKPLNIVLGYQRGDQILCALEQHLNRLGPTWRTGGDEFMSIVQGNFDDVILRVGALSWLFYTSVGATEAWSFQLEGGHETPLVPWRSFRVVCSPRCGVAALGNDVAEALELARQRCEELKRPTATPPLGFAPLVKQSWLDETILSVAACPLCGGKPHATNDDLGSTLESCGSCRASYRRINMLVVLGEVFEAEYS